MKPGKHTGISLTIEYNKKSGYNSIRQGFYFVTEVEYQPIRRIQFNWINVIDPVGNFQGIFLGVKLKRQDYTFEIQYREARDAKFEWIKSSSPVFASNWLAQFRYYLK